MVAVKVWLGGEGSCELGDSGRRGTLEALLLRVEPAGWVVAGATRWQRIRKYRTGAALRSGINHADLLNVRGLILEAWERGCEIVAFSRDHDGDDDRGAAVDKGIELSIAEWPIAVIGGVAIPCLEGWVLALLGVRDSDGMSRRRASMELDQRGIPQKRAAAYVRVVEEAHPDGLLRSLPVGSDSLRRWLEAAARGLASAIRGA